MKNKYILDLLGGNYVKEETCKLRIKCCRSYINDATPLPVPGSEISSENENA
ncbi:MAG: hypothetical protein PUK14_06630 [Clostridiales bacterium]|nr:hypothetical protein [Clostridiales bacterium]